MNPKNAPRCMLLMLLLTTTACAALIDTESFSQYKVDIDLKDDGIAHVTKTIVIQNEIGKPIVPGIAYLKVFKKKETRFLGLWTTSIDNVPLRIENLIVRDQNNNLIPSETSIEKNISTIQFAVWVPIPPRENYTIRLEYDTRDLVETGILFSEVSYPLPSSSIPIKNKKISIKIPDGSYLSYASAPKEQKQRLIWTADQKTNTTTFTASLEYTKIPFPRLPIHGAFVFWFIILLIVIIYLIGPSNIKKLFKKGPRKTSRTRPLKRKSTTLTTRRR